MFNYELNILQNTHYEIRLISLCFALINEHGIVGVFSQAEKIEDIYSQNWYLIV